MVGVTVDDDEGEVRKHHPGRCTDLRKTAVEPAPLGGRAFHHEQHRATPLPTDGQASPSDITQALAKGARMHGAKIYEGVAVTGFVVVDGRVL